MRELSLDRLRTFVCVLELGSFSSAARALHLAQPTVSLHISELESRLGVRLLDRGAAGMRVSAAGELLGPMARRLLREAHELEASIQRHRDGLSGRVRLGSSTGAMSWQLPDLLRKLDEGLPHIEVQLRVGRSNDLLFQLFKGDIDLAVVAMPQSEFPHLKVQAWRRVAVVALLPGDWDAPSAVTPGWLAERPLILNQPGTHIYQQAMSWFATAGLRPRPRVEMDSNQVSVNLVAQGYGATLLPLDVGPSELDPRVQVRPLQPTLVRELGLAAPDASRQDPATSAVLALLQGMADNQECL